MASLRCHGNSDCNKTQIIRNFHLYQGPTNTRPGRPGQPKKITGQVYFFTKKPTGPP